ncbi:efflux transporter outer membrane subunit [Sphingomonas sp. Leaf25]|uniref:efflux transporter outer membrane subunit n=1 Tax=Sphingomonas sp. Leaf25 TaxID=1735692 RepID=UPI0006FCA7B3|nr:efflux transporter outer membrane subunit [Sphingomonas sp. Leaf25]KQN00330.1 RND transporter [Sphingomonas sp. Leaf25]
MLRRSVLLGPALLATACTTGPAYRAPVDATLGVPPAFSVPTAAAPRTDLTRWWQRFDDPLLVRLVDSAAATNLDVAQAVARLAQAREQLAVSRSSLFPQLSASGSYSRLEVLRGGGGTTTLPDGTIVQRNIGASNSFSVGADASYQTDLFGGIRSGIAASRAQLEATRYDYATVLLSVQSEIARNYLTARLAQAQLANARASIALQDDNLEIAGFRVQAGLVSSLDVEQARTARAQTAAQLPTIEASYAAAVARLGVLTGQAPGALRAQLGQPAAIPVGDVRIGTGIPADTLRLRPDVLAAERNLAAAVAQIGVATAQLYPALNLGGSIDTNATSFGALTDIINGRLFSSIAQTIFDGGRLRAQVRGQRAAADAAFAAYKQTVLTALEDVENAIISLDTATRREHEFTVAADAARNFALLSRLQYRSGLTDFTTLNQAEASLLSAQNGVVQARADRASALVQLMTALGGGWSDAAIPDPAALPTPDRAQYTEDR